MHYVQIYCSKDSRFTDIKNKNYDKNICQYNQLYGAESFLRSL